MQRKIISLYERHFPAFLRRMIPRRLKVGVLGALFRITRHPDLGFRHARALLQMGQGGRAADLYTTPGSGAAALEDPLFQSRLTPVGRSKLHAEFGYRGLWLGGPAQGATWIDIRLDGIPLRREKLRGKAGFRYIIGREALALFPVESQLDVVDDKDNVLGVWQVTLPHGQGGLAATLAQRGMLEKKGGLRPDKAELAARQKEYLELFARVRATFEEEFARPIFILYGTLLGQHRSGDFIPGDDDFDVGYVSDALDFSAVRDEAMQMIERLVACGFTVALNGEGKPFRIRDDIAGPDIWLDNRPVFDPGDGYVWLHKHARLKLDLADFHDPEIGQMGGAEILKPRVAEAFLESYYGSGWRVPDPGFSNAARGVSAAVTRGLGGVNLTLSQQKALAAKLRARVLPGRFEPLALQRLYPLGQV